MTISVETLMAYIDGELAVDEARRVETEIGARPDLKAYVDQQLMLRQAVSRSFDSIVEAPLPERLLAVASRPPSFIWRMTHILQAMKARRALIWSGIPAAALACGVAIGVIVTAHSGADIMLTNGRLMARGALSTALNSELSGQTLKTAKAEIGITFRNKNGRYCRTFRTGGTVSFAGVACHENDGWHIAALARPNKEEDTGGTYALAGSTMPDAVRSAVRGMIVGSPLDAAGEEKARSEGWNSR